MSNKIKSLYHFTNVDSLIKILISDSFRINNIRNMNDIQEKKLIYNGEEIEYLQKYANEYFYDWNMNFELLFQKEEWNGTEEEKQYLIDNLQIEEANEFAKAIILADAGEYYKTYKPEVKNSMKEKAQTFRENIYLACFNFLDENETIWDKHSLWGHYGDRHKGVVIKFNKKRLLSAYNETIRRLSRKKFEHVNKLKVEYKQRSLESFLENLDKTGILRGKNYNIKYIKHKDAFKEIIERAQRDFINFETDKQKLSNKIKILINKRVWPQRCLVQKDEYTESEILKTFFKDTKPLKKNIDKILTQRYMTKNATWENENEFRILIYEDFTSEGFHLLKNIGAAIEEVIVGDDISNIDLGLLKKMKKTYLKKVIITHSSTYDSNLSKAELEGVKKKNLKLNKIVER
ncbi:MAG: DUF2971 domain-containing protein [Sarcina sp.]